MSEPTKEDWLRGDAPSGEQDEFARHAARGREELGSEEEARDLMNELDSLFAERFGVPGESVEATDLPSVSEGSAAGAEQVFGKSKDGAKVRRLGWYYAAAAVILLLVAAGSWWASQRDAFNPETLYAEAFSPYANDLSERTMGSDEPAVATMLDEALLAYDRRDYAAAAEGLGRHLAQPTNPVPAAAPTKVRLYYGISLLADNQPAAAITELEGLMNDPATGPPAAWYHALAQLRLGRTTEARAELTRIATGENAAFRERAKALLPRIPL
ncbi:hypothetical protein FUA23_08530 [Neolewinella aurantiaca]|uniref:Tetratricopeptide repeat protein n=1 Tax=Neolewinella aurantiaca TaxID=2602767 RepID=A0A5C7FHN3_9BACT|nr:hypothetical protein [Neolewinella aurantiaca]TXF89988.1 hypothetical protein FUA23_08530 [Neolewinella aurantiaca]